MTHLKWQNSKWFEYIWQARNYYTYYIIFVFLLLSNPKDNWIFHLTLIFFLWTTIMGKLEHPEETQTHMRTYKLLTGGSGLNQNLTVQHRCLPLSDRSSRRLGERSKRSGVRNNMVVNYFHGSHKKPALTRHFRVILMFAFTRVSTQWMWDCVKMATFSAWAQRCCERSAV